MNDNILTTAYRMKYYSITLSLLLPIGSTVYGQQVSCDPSCSNTTGGYINETTRVGELTVNNVTLTGTAPPSTSDDVTYQNTVISLGRGSGYRLPDDSEFNATNLKIESQAELDTHARAITLGSYYKNTTLTSNINDSSIVFNSSDNARDFNTIGLLMESQRGGQTYNVNLTNSDMHISSNAHNNMVGGIWTYSADGFAETNIVLDNSNLLIESALGYAYGIRTENRNNSQDSVITIQDINPGSISVKGYGAAYGIGIETNGKSTYIDNKSDINVQTTADYG